MNKIKITIEDLFNLKGAEIYNPDGFKSTSLVSTDTRTIKKNSVFIALKGEKFDGHNFVIQAIDKGASAMIINKNKLKDFDNVEQTIITVKDTTKAYGELARMWRHKLSAKVIAITGSNGKTTTKEMLSKILEEKYSVCKTLSNNNNHIGVPLTIFSANEKHDYLVLELGTNHFGEIAYTSAISEPDYALITNIGSSHLEFLKDYEGVADEKVALFTKTLGVGGKIFVNNDDKILKKRTNKIPERITYGFHQDANVQGEVIKINPDKSVIRIDYKNKKVDVSLPLSGITNAKNFLSAAAIALYIGMTPSEIKRAASKFTAVDKRLNVINLKDFILINDTYNANPESMKSAFEYLNTFNSGLKKIVVLGDMFELGEKSEQAHVELGKQLRKNKIDEVYAVGKMMKTAVRELANKKAITIHFEERESLGEFLKKYVISNAVVLVKGSRGMKMEEFVTILKDKMK